MNQPDLPLKVRIFIDTNVLIDYFEGKENNFSKEFIEEASKKEFIELITSDFVIFELIDFFRKEFYFENRMKLGWFSRTIRRGLKGFQKLSNGDWGDMKSYVKEKLEKIREKVEIVKLEDFISKEFNREFKDLVLKFLLDTKIEKGDILILLSALLIDPQPHIFLTKDEEFMREGRRISMLEEFLTELPIRITIKFCSPKPPGEISMEEYLRNLNRELGEFQKQR